MELTLNLEKEEFVELAKMIYIAQYVVDSSGPFSRGYKYPHFAALKNTQRRMNEALLQVIGNSGFVEEEKNNFGEKYTHTIKMEQEMFDVLEEFIQEAIRPVE
jgi:hypothetical protein